MTFTISQDQIKPELDRVFNSVKKSLNVPGFRKGHLPRPIFDKKFGEESLYQDVMNALLPNAYEAAVKEAGLEVVAQPKIDVTSMEKGQDWVITAEVVTKPEVKLGDYKNLEVSVDVEKEVTDADVEERIERERNNLAELIIKEAAAEKRRHCCHRLRWFYSTVLNLMAEKVKTSHLDLVQVNSSLVSKTNW